MALVPLSILVKLGKQGLGQPPNNRIAKGTILKVLRHLREKKDKYIDFYIKLNNKSLIKYTKEPII